MWKRWLLYLALGLAVVPLLVWLAFGPGVDEPYLLFTWPAKRLLWHFQPSAGSHATPDVLRESLVSALLWFLAFTVADAAVVAWLRRRTAG